MAVKWETIVVVNDEIDANLKKGFLEENGIPCVIEPTIFRPRSEVPFFNKFRIKVQGQNAQEAKEILSAVEGNNAK